MFKIGLCKYDQIPGPQKAVQTHCLHHKRNQITAGQSNLDKENISNKIKTVIKLGSYQTEKSKH